MPRGEVSNPMLSHPAAVHVLVLLLVSLHSVARGRGPRMHHPVAAGCYVLCCSFPVHVTAGHTTRVNRAMWVLNPHVMSMMNRAASPGRRRHNQPDGQDENEGRLKITHHTKQQKNVQSHFRLPDSPAKVSGHLDSPSRNRTLYSRVSILGFLFHRFVGVQSGPSVFSASDPRPYSQPPSQFQASRRLHERSRSGRTRK